jgi:carboxymethylenebutenolidase
MSSSSLLIRAVALLLSCATIVVAGCGTDESSSKDQAQVDTASDPARAPDPEDVVPAPQAGADAADTPVVAERLPYAEVDDKLVYGYFVFPADMIDPLPAVILIHDSHGLDDDIRTRADRLAAEGYIVLAVDLFGGASTSDPEQARLQMLSVVENSESARENIRQAYAFVSDTAGAPRVGSVGWDFGGGWSLNSATMLPDDLDAAVIIYGQVTDDPEILGPVDAPLLGLFAENDRTVTRESVRRFEVALQDLDKNYEIHVYPNVNHAFADSTSGNYDREVAEDAWRRTLEFLDLHLRIGDPASSASP